MGHLLSLIDETIKEFDETFDMSQYKSLRGLLHRIRDMYMVEVAIGESLRRNKESGRN